MKITSLYEMLNGKRSELNIKSATNQLISIYNAIKEFEKAMDDAVTIVQLNAILCDINGLRDKYISYLRDNRVDVLFARCADRETDYIYNYINKLLEINPDLVK